LPGSDAVRCHPCQCCAVGIGTQQWILCDRRRCVCKCRCTLHKLDAGSKNRFPTARCSNITHGLDPQSNEVNLDDMHAPTPPRASAKKSVLLKRCICPSTALRATHHDECSTQSRCVSRVHSELPAWKTLFNISLCFQRTDERHGQESSTDRRILIVRRRYQVMMSKESKPSRRLGCRILAFLRSWKDKSDRWFGSLAVVVAEKETSLPHGPDVESSATD